MSQDPRPTEEKRQSEDDVSILERFELLNHVQSILEPVMTALGLVFLVLLLLDFGDAEVGVVDQGRIDGSLQAIWAIFLLDFSVRFFIAPGKIDFLKSNWLTVISLALPFLRPLRAFRAFRAIRAVRSMSLVRLVGGINRGMRVLRQVVRGRQIVYVGILSVVVALAGAVGALFFENGFSESPIRSFGDAIWWSSALVTTMNNEKYVVSPEGRVLAIMLRIYALSVFGYVTASIATYFIGTAERSDAQQGENATLRAEISALREELAAMRRSLETARADDRDTDQT